MMRFSLLLATLMLGLLTGCATVIDSTTSEPISDNRGSRTAGQFIDDETAEIAIAVNLKKASPELKVSNINVKVYNGVVLVAGQVPSEDARQIAEKVTAQHRGVVRVINQLEIAGKATIISEINDLTISTQVKALVLKDLGRNVYQRTLITTENSIVYVMGFVSKTEATALENVVSSVRGVKRIVRVFEYID
ncbi:MAG: BON domain-containing protein [Gammaproteobacteria bacterium]|jgi:osmotically-inducible protein OsmY|nr:BON domain-containing protein [Gammaproteobacteria bacterium]NCW08216.1 BON domain-containing protein [Gammaproteobacteria bacterium]NCX47991.1 BON domain-containing protein [Gammaproteobacteria bacterium]